jgi:putative ABC transport system permease protein
MTNLYDWMRVAITDLRGDLRRFGILLACLALGCGTIAAVGSVGAALQDAIVRNANVLLGGDLEVLRPDRRANADELAYFHTLGQVSEAVDTSASGRANDNGAFLDLLAVDDNYPLLGKVRSPQLPEGQKPSTILGQRNGVWGAIVDPVLLDRLGIDIGGQFTIGGTPFEVRGLLQSLPDSAIRGFHLGLTNVIDIGGLVENSSARAPLPGLLTQHRYKIVLAPDSAPYEQVAPQIRAHLNDPNWTVRSPREAAGNLARYYDLFTRFLLIVGLSSLLVGGVGVSNAVSAYISERQRSIATLRSLGATGPRILVHFLTQIGLLSAVGIVIGLLIGAAATIAGLPVLGAILNVDLPPSVDLAALLTATGFGVLSAFAFSYPPLVRAQRLKPALLFRDVGSADVHLDRREYLNITVIGPLLVAAAGIFLLAMLATHDLTLVSWYAGGVVGAFLLLRVAGILLQVGLRRVPPLSSPQLRRAFHAIVGPGSPAPMVILSLGLGLAMLLVIVILDANLHSQLLGQVQRDAPTFVATDLFEDEVADLRTFLDQGGGTEKIEASPMLRAAVTKVRGVPSEDFKDLDGEAQFMLDGEIPVTWATDLPPQTTVTAGQWWPADYDGPPLVSLRDKMRESLGLKVGDKIELTLFGETVEATIANFRDYQWQNGLNFMVTMSPHSLDAYPSSWLATIKAKPGQEKTVERALARQYPDLTFIPVGDALNQAADIFSQLGTAVNIVGGLAVVNGLLVLAGTMAAGRKQREADAVVSKVLGSTRRDVLTAFAVEYGLLGAFAAAIATIVGILGAWTITSKVMTDRGFGVDPGLILGVIVGAVVLTIATGAVTTWGALSIRPARYLRALG